MGTATAAAATAALARAGPCLAAAAAAAAATALVTVACTQRHCWVELGHNLLVQCRNGGCGIVRAIVVHECVPAARIGSNVNQLENHAKALCGCAGGTNPQNSSVGMQSA